MRPKHILYLLSIACLAATALILLHPVFLPISLIIQALLLLLTLKILRDSQTDTLTGVSNLRKLANLHRHYHNAQHLTVVYLDVNELKQLNDSHGHEIGNQALKEVAAFMLQAAGDAGQVYRVGGDEFILISQVPTHALLQRWEKAIAQLRHVGISYGIAAGAGKDLEQLIHTAEQEMYTMKNHGTVSK